MKTITIILHPLMIVKPSRKSNSNEIFTLVNLLSRAEISSKNLFEHHVLNTCIMVPIFQS